MLLASRKETRHGDAPLHQMRGGEAGVCVLPLGETKQEKSDAQTATAVQGVQAAIHRDVLRSAFSATGEGASRSEVLPGLQTSGQRRSIRGGRRTTRRAASLLPRLLASVHAEVAGDALGHTDSAREVAPRSTDARGEQETTGAHPHVPSDRVRNPHPPALRGLRQSESGGTPHRLHEAPGGPVALQGTPQRARAWRGFLEPAGACPRHDGLADDRAASSTLAPVTGERRVA